MRLTASLRRRTRRLRKDEDGRVTAFVVIIALAALLFAGLVLDGGLALAAKVRAMGEAQEAARAGAQEIDLTAYRADGTLRLVPHQATAATHSYLSAAGHTGTVSVAGNTVNVTVSINQPTQLLGLVNIGSITVTATGQAQPQRGISDVSLGFANSEVDSDGNSSGGGR
ncbi:pilus assembly protein TadG-related protein [Amycolatopsis roodepoortensis]|uniref:Flp pilus assembly protein TadG n=1 Tax=Amycolatopsis roodepoortensis TaxID=700274 RepID=A0ABR9LFN9_9PSEU|nr:pilus assembly protein TadG-related protein [Amycolatopsis roodepoortensis]MBE1579501.1 Flp pilus assembly protein TadG [Amycolatopsis roodepoortensis]TWE14955.1 putative Flp pilus-assembly TadE/G-like protein [Prauserella muralis]SDU63014.1 Putative Flp pilus-assembly TadE/G-like [Amycolatopsis keratiniphila]